MFGFQVLVLSQVRIRVQVMIIGFTISVHGNRLRFEFRIYGC